MQRWQQQLLLPVQKLQCAPRVREAATLKLTSGGSVAPRLRAKRTTGRRRGGVCACAARPERASFDLEHLQFHNFAGPRVPRACVGEDKSDASGGAKNPRPQNKRMYVQTHPPDPDSPQSSAVDSKRAGAEERDAFSFFFFFNYVGYRRTEKLKRTTVTLCCSSKVSLKVWYQSVFSTHSDFTVDCLPSPTLGTTSRSLSGTLHSHHYFVSLALRDSAKQLAVIKDGRDETNRLPP